MKWSVSSAFAVFVFFSFLTTITHGIEVSSVAELENAVGAANRGGDKNIVIAEGTYLLGGVYLRITADGVTVSGKSKDRSKTILDGEYVTTEIFQILGSNVTIKNMTLKRAYYHPIHIFPDDKDVVGNLISNVHIIDPGQQAIKINQNSAKTFSVTSSTITGSRIELTDAGRDEVWRINGSCYTGGVDGHHTRDYHVVSNTIVGFWCPGGLSEHGIHFWSESEDTLVEKNKIINCDRGIGFGLGSRGHVRGIIRNNMIYHDTGHAYSDVGIGLENSSDTQVYNNTIFHEHGYSNGIEYRFSRTSGALIYNNLTNKAISSRNGGSASLQKNVTTASSSWFRSAATGDLHLSGSINGVVDSGIMVNGLIEDFDSERRPLGRGVDIGADEWSESSSASSMVLCPMFELLLDKN